MRDTLSDLICLVATWPEVVDGITLGLAVLLAGAVFLWLGLALALLWAYLGDH